MLQEYQCCNCKSKFSDKAYNYLYFSNGGSVKCENCGVDLVPVYDFYLMKRLSGIMIWIAVVGILIVTMCAIVIQFDPFGKWVALIVTVLFSIVGIWHQFLEVGTAARVLVTRRKAE